MIVYFIVAALLIAGLMLTLGIKPRDFEPLLQSRRKQKQRIRALSRKKAGKLTSATDDAQRMLDEAGMGEKMSNYKMLSVAMCAGGFFIGLVLDSILIAVILAAGFAAFPLIIIRFRTSDYSRGLGENIQTAMGMVTSSYIANPDIIAAVEDNIALIPAPLDKVFERFLVNTQWIDASIPKALTTMQEEIDNMYWQDWCGVLLQCQIDRTMRHALPGLVDRLGEMHRVRMEMETALRKQLSDYILTVVIVIGSIPLMGAMLPDFYEMLLHTTAGQVTLSVMLAAILGTAVWISKLFKPDNGR